MSAKSTQPVEAELDPPERPAAHASHRWDATRGPRRRRRGWLIVLLLVMALAALGYYRIHSSNRQARESAPNPPGVQGPNTTAITGVPAPLRAGVVATIQAIADPGATCTLSATDSRGTVVATGTGPVKADAKGDLSFAWHLDAHLAPGTYRLVVTCQPGTSSTSTLVVI